MSHPVSLPETPRPALRPENLNGLVLTHGLAMAAWRLPGSAIIRIVLSEKPLRYSSIRLEDIGQGFIFAPFRPDQEKLFLPADYVLEYDGKSLQERSDSKPLPIEYISGLTVTNTHNRPGGDAEADNFTVETDDAEKTAYLNLVSTCLQQIEAGVMEKVVVARRRSVQLPEDADPVRFFLRLAQSFPHAMVSMVSIPEIGMWIGASPEPLISLDNFGIFRTVALAGTKKFQPEIPIEAVSWTQKEIEEQALVERYIINCFKKIRLREYDEYGPKTFRAGNLLHLRSVFEVNLREIDFPELGTVMLDLLHPTSAVCGMPRQVALELIRASESFDREFYAGFLGPVHDQGETHLFVNLRCLKWGANHADLFAGAGITSGSVPVQEWEECEMKMQTLHDHLRFSSSNPS